MCVCVCACVCARACVRVRVCARLHIVYASSHSPPNPTAQDIHGKCPGDLAKLAEIRSALARPSTVVLVTKVRQAMTATAGEYPKPQTLYPKPKTPNPNPQPTISKPQTPNPKPQSTIPNPHNPQPTTAPPEGLSTSLLASAIKTMSVKERQLLLTSHASLFRCFQTPQTPQPNPRIKFQKSKP